MLPLCFPPDSLIARTSLRRPSVHCHLHSSSCPAVRPWDPWLYPLVLQATPATTKRHSQEQNQPQVCTAKAAACPALGATARATGVVVAGTLRQVFPTATMTSLRAGKVVLMACRPPLWRFPRSCHVCCLLLWHPCHLYIPASRSIPGHRTAAKAMGQPTAKPNHYRT